MVAPPLSACLHCDMGCGFNRSTSHCQWHQSSNFTFVKGVIGNMDAICWTVPTHACATRPLTQGGRSDNADVSDMKIEGVGGLLHG